MTKRERREDDVVHVAKIKIPRSSEDERSAVWWKWVEF